MKKLISIALTLMFLFYSLNTTVFAEKPSGYEEDFDTSCVLVTIKHEYSIEQHTYTPELFSDEYIDSIEPIMLYSSTEKENTCYNKDKFCDILSLKLKTPNIENVEDLIQILSRKSFVKTAFKNYYYHPDTVISYSSPNDTYYNTQYGLELIEAKRAWCLCQNGNAIKVGVIDTGIDEHYDLSSYSNSYVENYNFTDDNAGLTDTYLHGTHVAGIIGATINNSLGVAGTAKNVQLINLKVFKTVYENGKKKAFGSYQWIADAIDRAAFYNITIINCSFSGTADSDMEDAITNYGGLVIASAGNDGNNDPNYPASFTNNCIIAVAATNASDQLYSDSSYGATNIDLAAPGVSIKSTINNNGYGNKTGTSMAAPFVTGVAAMIASVNPGMSRTFIKYYILSNVDVIAGLSSYVGTSGRLNAFNALRSACGYIMGDVDFDNSVTAADARLVLRCSVELETFSSVQLVLADMDKSGTITSEDARLVLQASVGL